MRRRRLWIAVVVASIALMFVGVFTWKHLVDGERDLRAAHLVPPHRGAATTLAGGAIGLGLSGLILGVAALLPGKTR